MKYRIIRDVSHYDSATTIVDGDGKIIAQVADEERTRLFAAAPSMYEALKQIVLAYQCAGEATPQDIRKAKEAIVMAEGRP